MRHLALRPLVAVLALLTSAAAAAEGGKNSREIFLAAPKPGVAVLAATYATRPAGGELLSLHQLMSRSDTVDLAFMRHSADGDDLTPVIVAAVAADVVRALEFAAVRAFIGIRRDEEIVRATHVAAGRRGLALGNGHEAPVSINLKAVIVPKPGAS